MAKNAGLSVAEANPLAVRTAVTAAVTAVVHVAVVVGVVDHDTEVAVSGAVDALGALALLAWSIRAVVPRAKVVSRVTTSGSVVAGDAAVLPTGTPLPVQTAGDALVVTPPVSVNPALVGGKVPDNA